MSRPLPRFTEQAIHHDPLEQHIANMQAREAKAREQVLAGHVPQASAEEGRGIPLIARGIGGTSPGTDPYLAVQHWPER